MDIEQQTKIIEAAAEAAEAMWSNDGSWSEVAAAAIDAAQQEAIDDDATVIIHDCPNCGGHEV